MVTSGGPSGLLPPCQCFALALSKRRARPVVAMTGPPSLSRRCRAMLQRVQRCSAAALGVEACAPRPGPVPVRGPGGAPPARCGSDCLRRTAGPGATTDAPVRAEEAGACRRPEPPGPGRAGRLGATADARDQGPDGPPCRSCRPTVGPPPLAAHGFHDASDNRPTDMRRWNRDPGPSGLECNSDGPSCFCRCSDCGRTRTAAWSGAPYRGHPEMQYI